jgi:uncharacterized protein (DUF433 family)
MAHERIEMNPDIMGGKPVIKGTRVPVETVLRKLGAGMTPEQIIADHPRLTATTSALRRLLPRTISRTKMSFTADCRRCAGSPTNASTPR